MAWIVRLLSTGAEGEEHGTDVLRIARPSNPADLASLGLTPGEGNGSRPACSGRSSPRRPGSMPRAVRRAGAAAPPAG